LYIIVYNADISPKLKKKSMRISPYLETKIYPKRLSIAYANR